MGVITRNRTKGLLPGLTVLITTTKKQKLLPNYVNESLRHQYK
jgi:hypothetical protein